MDNCGIHFLQLNKEQLQQFKVLEFAKSRAMCACIPTQSTYQRACVPAWFTCQRACVLVWFTGQRVGVPKACQLLIFTCLRVIRSVIVLCWWANFSTWRTNVPKSVPIFQLLVLPNTKKNFHILLLYKSLYILLDIRVIHTFICIVNKNSLILCFYTSCHINEKFVEFLFFYYFCLFCSLVKN